MEASLPWLGLVGYGPIHAQVLRARNRPGDLESARGLLKRSIDLTRSKGADYYEFEATVGLAELELADGRHAEARLLITDLLSRLGDRRGLPGLSQAQDLLDRASTHRHSPTTDKVLRVSNA
jgi:hypothetical protein